MTKNLDYEPSEDSNPAEDYDCVSDSDLEVDEVAEPAMKANNPVFGTENSNTAAGNHNELAHQGNVVLLRGFSYLTLVKVSFPPPCLHIEDLIAFRRS